MSTCGEDRAESVPAPRSKHAKKQGGIASCMHLRHASMPRSSAAASSSSPPPTVLMVHTLSLPLAACFFARASIEIIAGPHVPQWKPHHSSTTVDLPSSMSDFRETSCFVCSSVKRMSEAALPTTVPACAAEAEDSCEGAAEDDESCSGLLLDPREKRPIIYLTSTSCAGSRPVSETFARLGATIALARDYLRRLFVWRSVCASRTHTQKRTDR